MRTERRRFMQTAALAVMPVLIGAGVWLTGSRSAQAAADPNADVMELQGTQVTGAGSIDPRIGNVPQLKKPPLSAYNTYKLIDKKSQPAKKGVASSYTLANGRVLQVTVVETTSENRYRVLTTISEANASVYLKKLEVIAGPNEPFFVGGQYIDTKNPDKGGLVLGITIRP